MALREAGLAEERRADMPTSTAAVAGGIAAFDSIGCGLLAMLLSDNADAREERRG